MKKTILTVAVALCVTGAFAQDLTSKKGEPILPEADDWAVSIEATPFFNYFGNMLNGSTSNGAPTWNFLTADQTIIGKMFADEKTAYRAIIRIGFTSAKNLAKIAVPSAVVPTYPAVPTLVDDEQKISNRFIGLGGGIEMRRGKTRLQGYYGGDGMFYMSGGKSTYSYGNALAPAATPAITVANSTNFGTNIVTLASLNMPYAGNARILENKQGSTIGIVVRGFIGAEYFILPKISIGGEFGWGIGFSSTGENSINAEAIGPNNVAAPFTVSTTGKSGGFGIDTENGNNHTNGPAGQLRATLHF